MNGINKTIILNHSKLNLTYHIRRLAAREVFRQRSAPSEAIWVATAQLSEYVCELHRLDHQKNTSTTEDNDYQDSRKED